MSLFSERLRKLREQTGKTQAWVASDLGLRPQTMSYYINGREPDYDTLAKIAQYFNVTTDYLVGLTDSPEKRPAATDELGLTQKAVETLQRMKKTDSTALIVVNCLLETFSGEDWGKLPDMKDIDASEFVRTLKHLMSLQDRQSAIGSLVAYLNPPQINDKDIVLTKTMDILIENRSKPVDPKMIQAVCPANEVLQIMLERNLTSSLDKLKQTVNERLKEHIHEIFSDIGVLDDALESSETDGNDPEAR